MKRIGSYEAKTHLPRLLAEVEAGETVVITRHGIDIAKIVPAQTETGTAAADVIDRMKERRAKRSGVTVEEILSARDEGRKPAA